MAKSEKDWSVERDRVAQMLVRAAKLDKDVTYGDLGHELGMIARHPKIKQLLDEIVDISWPSAHCMVTAVVVRKGTRRPGYRFFEKAAELGFSVKDERAFHKEQRPKAVAYLVSGNHDWAGNG